MVSSPLISPGRGEEDIFRNEISFINVNFLLKRKACSLFSKLFFFFSSAGSQRPLDQNNTSAKETFILGGIFSLGLDLLKYKFKGLIK